ncbi:phosphotransferase enzyme family protein [Kribbella swartbergensis]
MIQPSDLARDYGIAVSQLRPHPGGFTSDCWVADEAWFVKVWRQPETPHGIELLGDLRATGLPVPAPVPTVSGELHATLGGRPYAVFSYISGRTATRDDWRQTAQALRRVHSVEYGGLPPGSMDEPAIWRLRDHLDHPWISDRREEVAASIDRLERAIQRAQAKTVRHVVCHRDFGGFNLILGDDGEVAAIVDWEQAVLGPREHDVWIAAEGKNCAEFLTEYGARDLDLDHLEYALLARALRDLAARVLHEVDRPGVDTWGFGRIARLDGDLARFRPFCGWRWAG